jgi:hypothetical protein
MLLSGYAIVRRSEFELEEYMKSELAQKNSNFLQTLREALPFVDPSRYRGTGRSWLMAFPSVDPTVIGDFSRSGCNMRSDARARLHFRELIGEFNENRELEGDEDLLAEEWQATEVFSMLDDTNQHELLYVCRREFPALDGLLGYDIGYWGGDHFSLIADSFVTPRWHPPQPDIFNVLADQLRDLNAHVLFPTAESAAKFRAWYRGQYWAETESFPDEFEIIQVNSVKAA